jgi:putative toxin-antitoxin system antitoxin component (TIGR02293 family)
LVGKKGEIWKKNRISEKCRKFVSNVRMMRKVKFSKVKPCDMQEEKMSLIEDTISPQYARGGLAHAIALLGLAEPDSILDAPSDLDLVALIRTGLTKKALDCMLNAYNITSLDMARILHVSDRTMRRYETESVLNPEQSERLIELARLFAHGMAVFGSKERFRRWLQSEVYSLGGQKPFDLLDTSIGIGLVNDVLGRIEYGIVA